MQYFLAIFHSISCPDVETNTDDFKISNLRLF